jgi:hypothetical protein
VTSLFAVSVSTADLTSGFVLSTCGSGVDEQAAKKAKLQVIKKV